MKSLLTLALLLFVAAGAFGQARPGDSIIFESKTVAPGFYPGSNSDTAAYLYVKMYLTSQDSLTFLTLPLKTVSTSGGAYGILGYPRTFFGIITPLSNYFRNPPSITFWYDNSSPDTFLLAAGFDPVDPSTIAPPFNVRTAIWEIKFDTVRPNAGTFELDSATIMGLKPTFTDMGPTDYPVNFVKSIITVIPAADPRDSVILESKIVLPGAGDPAFTMKVYITNKDSLTFLTLALKESTLTNGAYAQLSGPWCPPRNFMRFLTNTLNKTIDVCPFPYEGKSPDRFIISGGFDPFDLTTIEPPNATRKAIWEITFDSVFPDSGTFEIDSTHVQNLPTTFTTTEPRELPVNFVKSVITVRPKGDFNLDGSLSGADVVELLNCVFDMGMPGGGAYPCDLNCDNKRSPADVILELMAVFMGRGFPC